MPECLLQECFINVLNVVHINPLIPPQNQSLQQLNSGGNMKQIKYYECESCTPTNEEILQCIEIANNENCIVNLKWFFPYSGWYTLRIIKGMTFENCKEQLPKVYGV